MEEIDNWKASFLRAGVYPERQQAPEHEIKIEQEIVSITDLLYDNIY